MREMSSAVGMEPQTPREADAFPGRSTGPRHAEPAVMTLQPSAPAVAPPSWSIRPELPIDLDQIHELHRDAFRGPEEAELVDAIRDGPDFVPELSLVAVTEDGSVLGHVLVSIIGFDPYGADASRTPVLALAPLAVLPPHQGRGVGAGLMRAVLAGADRRDEPFMAVVGSAAYYGRFGFVPALRHGLHGPYDAAGDAFQARPREGRGAVPPGTLVYPAAFADV